MSGASAVVRARLASAAEAQAVLSALAPENAGFVQATIEDERTVVARAEAASPMKLLATLDDYLACLTVAEKAARAGVDSRTVREP